MEGSKSGPDGGQSVPTRRVQDGQLRQQELRRQNGNRYVVFPTGTLGGSKTLDHWSFNLLCSFDVFDLFFIIVRMLRILMMKKIFA